MTIEEKKTIRFVLIGIGIISAPLIVLAIIDLIEFRTSIEIISGATITLAIIGMLFMTSENKE